MSLKGMIEKVIGTYSDRALKKITPVADKVMALEAEIEKLSDEELRNKTFEFKERLAKGETLDDILPEAFAVCREASWRVLGMKHFYVQVIGGIVLHQGRIAEMKTGEGKTLVATLAAYLNALTGKGVHVVTVNDYLAKRDSEWMGKLYNFLGLTVGLIISDMMPDEKKEAYNADITYGTNNEMGFDYLRDNMVIYKEDRVQRGHVFAMVDEVDSSLVDEERNPYRQTLNINLGTIGSFKDTITQSSSKSTTKAFYQDGYTMGYLDNFKIDSSGVITGVYSNGTNRTIGQIAMASFTNQQGLETAGDNTYVESNNSGMARIGESGVAGKGTLMAGALEMSNVDLSEQMTDMIVTQRGFQSNAKTIQTADTLLETVLSLKR